MTRQTADCTAVLLDGCNGNLTDLGFSPITIHGAVPWHSTSNKMISPLHVTSQLLWSDVMAAARIVSEYAQTEFTSDATPGTEDTISLFKTLTRDLETEHFQVASGLVLSIGKCIEWSQLAHYFNRGFANAIDQVSANATDAAHVRELELIIQISDLLETAVLRCTGHK